MGFTAWQGGTFYSDSEHGAVQQTATAQLQ